MSARRIGILLALTSSGAGPAAQSPSTAAPAQMSQATFAGVTGHRVAPAR
jgi:hypothetical protein